MGIMFAPDMLALVLAGKKTQTRRRVDDTDYVCMSNGATDWVGAFVDPAGRNRLSNVVITSIVRSKRAYRRVGKDLAVQPGRGKKAVGRVRITAIRLETFASISQADAEAEGFTDAAGFHAKIRELYGDDFDMSAPCWVLEFKLVGGKA